MNEKLRKILLKAFDEEIESRLCKRLKDNIPRIKDLRDLHKGQRCFIVATGPSLKHTNLSLLKDEIVFGINSLCTGNFGIKYKYYAINDAKVWAIYYKEILKEDTTFLLGRSSAKSFTTIAKRYPHINPICFDFNKKLLDADVVDEDITHGLYNTRQIVGLTLQIINFMGFDEVYLLGCDCDYSSSHHFDDSVYDFQSPTSQKQVSSYWQGTFKEYEIIKSIFDKNNRKIFNATVGGQLEVFDRVKLEDVLSKNW